MPLLFQAPVVLPVDMCLHRFRLLIFLFFILYIAGGQGCTRKEVVTTTIEELSDKIARNKPAIDSGIALLQQGDIVLRTGNDMTSYMLSQLNPTDKTWSHCGIVLIEDGQPFIYHSIGGEDNPDQKLMRDSAFNWATPVSNLGFGILRFSLADTTVKQLTDVTRTMYAEHRMFDMDFDLATDNHLYCAEFVYKAMRQATHDTALLTPITLFGFTYFPVDRLLAPKAAQLIWQVRYK